MYAPKDTGWKKLTTDTYSVVKFELRKRKHDVLPNYLKVNFEYFDQNLDYCWTDVNDGKYRFQIMHLKCDFLGHRAPNTRVGYKSKPCRDIRNCFEQHELITDLVNKLISVLELIIFLKVVEEFKLEH